MIVVYLPNEKILFEADMLDFDIPENGIAPAGEDTNDLLKGQGEQVGKERANVAYS